MRWFAKMIRINLPDLGEGTKEATIKEWFVKEGQRIKEVLLASTYLMIIQYDDICEVFTDKLVAKIPSTHDGIIKSIKYKNDDICLVGKPLVEIEVEEEAGSATTSAAPKQENKQEKPLETSNQKQCSAQSKPDFEASNAKKLATPAVRSIAKRHGIDLSKVQATGKDGRVMKEDILSFINGGQKEPVQP